MVGCGAGLDQPGALALAKALGELGGDGIHQDLGVAALGIHLAIYHDDSLHLDHLPDLVPGAGEDDQLDGALDVFDGDKSHGLAGLGLVVADAGDQAGHAYRIVGVGITQLAGVVGDHVGQLVHHGAQRVIGDVQADQLALPVEHIAAADFVLDLGQGDGLDHASVGAEQAHLAGFGGAEMGGAHRHKAVHRFEQGLAGTEIVQRADLGHALQRPAAHLAQVDPAGKLVEVIEGAALLASLEDGVHGTLADVLDGAQAETDDGGFLAVLTGPVFNREIPLGIVDVGRRHLHAHAAGIGHVQGDFLGLVFGDREQGGHVLDGVMELEVGGLDGDDAVVGGVTVMHQDIVGDEVVRAGHFQVVGHLVANVLDRLDPVPVDIAAGIAAQARVIKEFSQAADGWAGETHLPGTVNRVELALGHAGELVELLPGQTLALFSGTHQGLHAQGYDILTSTTSIQGSQAIQFFPAKRADEVRSNPFGKSTDGLLPGNEDLVANAPIFVGESHLAQAAEDAQAQKQMLQLAGHAFRGSSIVQAAPFEVDMAVAFPHAADQQANLRIGQLEGSRWDLFGMGVLAPDAQRFGPGDDTRLNLAVQPAGIY